MIKVTGKNAVIYFEVDVKVGELEVTRHYHVWVGKNTEHYDLDLVEQTDIKYMNIAIVGWQNFKKFREFHLEMGIDFDKAIQEEANKILTKEALAELVEKEIKNFTLL